MLFRNLEAEQKRFGLSNREVADELGVSRTTYEKKKKNGKFNRAEIAYLLQRFNSQFDYLFAICERDELNHK